ncbi:hypothetical protein SteCoe_23942 [Stentor coeruleus]|uniref:Uncharacterized protein n=1 Tax=Stentor coeruleus TaxID=5963 RepID=A0A1R2BIP1_9CILI|nr:hypothetical protein SteCoe_23942 [Stentor coeruleus]
MMNSANNITEECFEASIIKDIESINTATESSISSSLDDQIIKKFESIERRLDMIGSLSELNMGSQSPLHNTDYNNLASYIKALESIKEKLSTLQMEISDKTSQNYIENFKIKKLKNEISIFDTKCMELDIRCGNFDKKIEGVEESITSINEMLDKIQENCYKDDEYKECCLKVDEAIRNCNIREKKGKSKTLKVEMKKKNKLGIQKYSKTCKK